MALLKATLTINGERIEQSVVILKLERHLLDLGSCPIKERVDQLVYEGHMSILLNMEHLKRMDSADIGKLIRAHHSVRQVGGEIHICMVEEEIRKLLELTRLDTVFDIYETEEEAVRKLAGPDNPFGSSLPTLA